MSFKRENCNKLQKSLAGAVAKNATAHKKIRRRKEEPAMKELMGMMTAAAQQYCEATKEGTEKHEVLN